jgi:peptide/nickel transport system substrate-binding protein
MRYKTALVGGAVALLLLVVAACGGDDGDTAGTTTTDTTTQPAAQQTTETQTTQTTTAAATTTQQQTTGSTSVTVSRTPTAATQTTTTTSSSGGSMMKEAPVRGGTFNSFVFGGSRTFDPGHFDFRGAAPGCSLQHGYDRLVDYERPYNPEHGATFTPGLAKSWETNAAGDVWTFRLEEGVKFHDGSDFDADDVVATFGRLLDPNWDPSTRIGSTYKEFITEVEAVDSHTVQFTLDSANRTMIPFMVNPYGSHILSSDDVRAAPGQGLDGGNWNHVTTYNGTGPWILVDYDGENGQKWEANPNYWGKDADGNPYPYMDEYIQPVIRDETTRFALLQSGGIDVWPGCGPTVKRVEGEALISRIGADKMQGIDSTRALYTFYFINWELPPFDNPMAREALRRAIPVWQQYCIPNQCLGLPGRGVNSDWYPAHSVSADEYADFAGMSPTPQGQAEDLQRAKQLLCDAGFPDCKAEFTFTQGLGEPGVGFEMWTVAINAMREAGFVMDAQLKEYGVFMAEIREGRWHMTRENLFQSVNDPLDPYAISLLSVGTGLGGRPWYYPGQERMDEVFFRYARAIDNAAAQEEAKAIERILNEPQLPMISIGWPATNRMYYLYVKNWFPGPGSMTLEDLKHVWIDKGQ